MTGSGFEAVCPLRVDSSSSTDRTADVPSTATGLASTHDPDTQRKTRHEDRAKRNRTVAVSQGGDWLIRAIPTSFGATCPLLENTRVTSPALREFVLRSVTHGSRACPPTGSCIAGCAAPASWSSAGDHLQARCWRATRYRGRSAG